MWSWDIDESVFTPEKVKTALQSFSPFKSCGTDDLKPIVFKNLGPKAINFVAKAMQASYSLGYIPRTWLETKSIFIPKPAKYDYGLVIQTHIPHAVLI